MKDNFKIIFLVVFIVFAILAVLIFADVIPLGNNSDKTTPKGTVTLWGTVGKDLLNPVFDEFNKTSTFSIKYVQKYPETFDQELLEAIASGKGPDIFFLPDNLAFDYINKIYTIPYESYPIDTFKKTFAGGGEVFLTSKGVLAFPISIDPLVLYYNRSTLDSNSIVYPPTYWDDLVAMVPTLTKKDSEKQIVKSTIGLGQFSNVNNAKDIINTLFMQIGNPIIVEKSGVFYSSVYLADSSNNKKTNNLAPLLSFYTSFADPLKENYSWNKSFQSSKDTFSSEKSAFYIGFSSEIKSLINKNPNQNLAVSPMLQMKNTNSKITLGRVTGIAISSFSKNQTAALAAASTLSTGDFAKKFSELTGVPPARRDLLATKPSDSYMPVFYSSALFAKSWLDPSPHDTDALWQSMVEKVLSNTLTAEGAVSDTFAKLNLLLK